MIFSTYYSYLHETWLITFGYALASIGIIANTIVVFANGCRMPVITEKHRDDFSEPRPIHRLAKDGDRFLFLADKFHSWFGVFSIGDIFIFFGIVTTWLASYVKL